MITITDLVKNHGSTQVLCGVSLAVRQGEVAVIVGPSGGGKSTLLRCINGLETFDGGTLTVDGLTLGARGAAAGPQALQKLRLRVGMVFQQFHLFPHMTALENVMSGPIHALGRPRGETEQAARRLLDRVGLADKCASRPDQLSGGQQQRVAIARALAMQPQAILFDEPTSALDPRMAAEVMAVMRDLAKGGQTMAVVTHAMSFARGVAHTVHVMDGGKMVESGAPDKIFGAPEHAVTKSFLAEAGMG